MDFPVFHVPKGIIQISCKSVKYVKKNLERSQIQKCLMSCNMLTGRLCLVKAVVGDTFLDLRSWRKNPPSRQIEMAGL